MIPIDIWSVDLTEHMNELPQLQAMLSLCERYRAERLHFAHDRRLYIIRHGILRIILSEYLGRRPAEIRFAYGVFGKPEVRDSGLHFNMSHSSGVAVYAASRACPVGVDVEHIRDLPGMAGLASRLFTAGQTERLGELPRLARLRHFYSCWTRREAAGKAIGVGLTDSRRAEVECCVHYFTPRAGFIAAVAFRQIGQSSEKVWLTHRSLSSIRSRLCSTGCCFTH